MSERVLTQRELNRALLARQLLLERAPLTPVRALEQVAGLQAQDTRAPYIGLWSRVEDFRREQLTGALHRRTAIKATLMRATIHLVSARDYSLFLPAILPMLRGYWRRYATSRGYAYEPEELMTRAREYTREPRSARELQETLGGEGPWWRLRFHEPFVHVPHPEEWAFRRQPRYMAAEHWARRPFAAEEDGTAHLVRRYLAGFGPATAQDVAAWSGVPMATLRPALDALRLRRFRDERGRVLLDVPRAPLPPPDTPAPPRLLAPFDNAVLSHARPHPHRVGRAPPADHPRGHRRPGLPRRRLRRRPLAPRPEEASRPRPVRALAAARPARASRGGCRARGVAPVSERVLTTRELNRALLARQLLLERSPLSIPRAVEQLAGLQTQYAPSAYIRLWTSLQRFELGHLTQALERKRVVQATLMRSTIHIVSPRDFWRFSAGIGPLARSMVAAYARAEGRPGRPPRDRQELRKRLAGGTKHRSEVAAILGAHGSDVLSGAWVELVRVPPSGTWERRRADLFRLAEEWLGPSTSPRSEGLEHLLRRYLARLRPGAARRCRRLGRRPCRRCEPAAERMRLRRFRDEEGKELLDLPRAPLPRRRARTGPLPPDLGRDPARPRSADADPPGGVPPSIFNTRTPQSATTFLVDGVVAGAWRMERTRRRRRSRSAPFERLPRTARQERRRGGGAARPVPRAGRGRRSLRRSPDQRDAVAHRQHARTTTRGSFRARVR